MYAVSSARNAHNSGIVGMKGENPFGALREIISPFSVTMETIRQDPDKPIGKALKARAGGMHRYIATVPHAGFTTNKIYRSQLYLFTSSALQEQTDKSARSA